MFPATQLILPVLRGKRRRLIVVTTRFALCTAQWKRALKAIIPYACQGSRAHASDVVQCGMRAGVMRWRVEGKDVSCGTYRGVGG